MSRQRIERVDDIPLILYWLKKMRVQEIIDTIWQPHLNWQGLSYGQLAVLFLTYVVHCRLSAARQAPIIFLEWKTGWCSIGPC